MNEIRIDQLHVKCRGLSAATVRAALNELGPALSRRWKNGAATGTLPSAAGRVPPGITPGALAGALAAHIGRSVRAAASRGNPGAKF
jgi:hypothetical protein